MSFFYEIPAEFRKNIDQKNFFEYIIRRLNNIDGLIAGEISAVSAFGNESQQNSTLLEAVHGTGTFQATYNQVIEVFGAGTILLPDSPILGSLVRVILRVDAPILINGNGRLVEGDPVQFFDVAGTVIDCLYSVVTNEWNII